MRGSQSGPNSLWRLVGGLHLQPLDVTALPNGASGTPHRSGTLSHVAPLDEPCQDDGRVTESLLPSCCEAGG